MVSILLFLSVYENEDVYCLNVGTRENETLRRWQADNIRMMAAQCSGNQIGAFFFQGKGEGNLPLFLDKIFLMIGRAAEKTPAA